MLYRIYLPPCAHHLEWVVQLQSDLLHALCNPGIGSNAITVDWVKGQRPDVDGRWIERFCDWSMNRKSILERMKDVVTLPESDKQDLIKHYEDNFRYPEAFNETAPLPPATMPLPDGLSEMAAPVYRSFFEMFYAPIFYRDKGYPIDAPELNGELFSKDEYLEAYHRTNPELKVCPFCDGGMDGAQLDHWLAQKHLPEFNCHAQNLVEICAACNSRANKGERLALDSNEPAPFANWFHPHLRSAAEHFEISKCDANVRLLSDDSITQTRLDNLDNLINLSSRWSREWQNQFDRVLSRIRNCKRRGELEDEAGLRAKLEYWKTDAEDDIGRAPYAMLTGHLLSLATCQESDIFKEFLKYAKDEA